MADGTKGSRNVFPNGLICFVLVVLLPSPTTGKQIETESAPRLDDLVTTVEHALWREGELEGQFKPRGMIILRGLKNPHAIFQQKEQLSRDELQTIKEMAEKGAYYRIRVPSKFGSSEENSDYVSTFVKACALYESNLTETITLSVDHLGYIYGVGLRLVVSECEGKGLELEAGFGGATPHFNTTVQVFHQSSGPLPDTQTYIQRIEKEKREKVAGTGQDNRSFLAKYWMYIVPIVIFMLMSSQQTDQQGGGEGGS